MFEGEQSEPAPQVPAQQVLARFDAVLDELAGLELTALGGEEVLDLLRGVEQRTRRLAPVDHALIAEVEARGLARERGCGSSATLLTRMLRVGAGEARARVQAAEQLAARRALSGEAMLPRYPATAAAQAAGEISAAHARLITTTIDKLPVAVRDEKFDDLEGFLVTHAHQFNPDQLAKIGRHLADVLDPDGTLRDTAHRHRTRYLDVRQRPDGSAHVEGDLTAQATEALLTILDTTAAPEPAADGVPDQRTPAQRRHDGLLDALLMLLRSDQLPTTAGVSTTIVYTLTADQLVSGEGLAHTGHGATVPVHDVLANIGDARTFAVQFAQPPCDNAGPDEPSPDESPPEQPPPLLGVQMTRIEAYSTSHRIFTESQRLAMFARDHGCQSASPALSLVVSDQRSRRSRCCHQVPADRHSLLCGYHHREFERLGWQCHMLDGIPHWTPPRWIDPSQTPRSNHAHQPQLVG